jgi:uncharacterized membrane protein YcaP (DUF421 family)
LEDPVVPFDIVRMFLGSEPPLFYLEILARTCIIYAYSLVLIRWVGGRGIAQMSTVEFLLVIALGSAVGDAMFYPDVPLLHAMLVITAVVVINKVLDVLIYRYQPVEKVIDGRTAEAVRDGVIVVETLRHAKIGKSELFESLRQAGFTNLGEVRSAYLESSGRFSFFRADTPRPGLPVEPAWDVAQPEKNDTGTRVDPNASMVCCDCGTVAFGAIVLPEKCSCCGGISWTSATASHRHEG